MTIKIVTDSTSDLEASDAESYGITILPVSINIGEKTYQDGVDLTRAEFYRNLPTYTPFPTTASPSLHAFQQTYQTLVEQGATGIISIHIAGSLSGTVNAAIKAAETITKIPIRVIDSGNLTLGTGFQALAAAKAAMQGKSLEEIISVVKNLAQRTVSFALPDTLDYLRRGGRLSLVQYEVGKLFNIKPILVMRHSTMKLEKAFTFRNSMKRVMEIISEQFLPIEEFSIIHTGTLERVEEFKQMAKQLLPPGYVPRITEVTPAIGAHVGPGGLGAVCVSATR
jgi:DegV family protein with EDD domain